MLSGWKKLLLTLPIALLMTISAHPAFAHTSLLASDPVANAVLDRLPQEISLTFNEELLVIEKNEVNYMTLHDPTGQEVSLGDMKVNGSVLSADVETINDLESKSQPISGEYHLRFRVAGSDGHIVRGELHFSITADGEIGNESTSTSNQNLPSDSVSSAEELALASLILVLALVMVVIYMRAGEKRSS